MDSEERGRGGGRAGCSPCPEPLTSFSPSPSPHPEKIFSEVTPKCEDCQSVVKPGEPWGQGPTEGDLDCPKPNADLETPHPTDPFPRRPQSPSTHLWSPSLQGEGSVPWPVPAALHPQPSPEVCLLLLPVLCRPLFTVFFCPVLSVCPSVSTSDIVFFGENLPARFFSCIQSVSVPITTLCSAHVGTAWTLPWGGSLPQLAVCGLAVGTGVGREGSVSAEGGALMAMATPPSQDFLNVDLLIIMGTSLQVQPFASLISK